MSKEQILENYLNLVYFGNGTYGVRRRRSGTSPRPPTN